MRWEQAEFVLKGVYLGLLLAIGLREPAWWQAGLVGLVTLGALALCLSVAAIGKLREGYRIRGRLLGFLLYLILENPVLVYTGVLGGLALGYYSFLFDETQFDFWLTLGPLIGGAAIGIAFRNVRDWADRRWRLWGSLVVAIVLGAGAVMLMDRLPPTFMHKDRIAYLLLLGIPGFYLLTFAGMTEESEIDIAAICAALGFSLYIVGEKYGPYMGSPYAGYYLQTIPAALYFYYTRRVLPELRVFKHVLRGIGYTKVGRHRLALISFGRALTLDPGNRIAREQLWRLFQDMDFDQLVKDPETLAVVNFELCLERVAWLLLQTPVKPEQVTEAIRLIDLVESQRPALTAPTEYWRAVALLHRRDYEPAAAALERVLAAPDDPLSPDGRGVGVRERRAVLVPAWQLALLLHPEMIRRVGTPMITQPGRRMEAIAAVERLLAIQSEDQAAWDLKRVLYADLSEAEYAAWAGDEQPAADFDHAYVVQLGQALLQDTERWQRGCEYLRIAARGLPLQAPNLFVEIGRAHERAGDVETHRKYLHGAKQAGRAIGPQNLATADRDSLFAAVKWLGDTAVAKGNMDEALDCLHFYTLYEKVGKETYRALAEVYEQKKDVWVALHCTEHALTYDAHDQELLDRKDRYYFSVTAEELKKRWDNVYKWFDLDYCKQKVRKILERPDGNVELLDWAAHLADLAQTANPSSLSARLLQARIERLRGEVAVSRALLEEIRKNRPEKFPSGEEEEAWYTANRHLGEMYVDDKPDQAVLCLLEYKKFPKSGAATLFQLARAYENLGDHGRALRYYEQVASYEGNPLVWEAQDAMRRLRGGGSGGGTGGEVPSRGETQ